MVVYKILFIGSVWPEPQSSAAGLRIWNLVEACKENGWEIIFAADCLENSSTTKLQEAGIRTQTIQLNHTSFDIWVRELAPNFVLFDRFPTEEQYGWRVKENCPEAVRILDTVDLHFLRRARGKALKNGTPFSDIVKGHIELYTDDTLRELGSIYRSDCTLILSDFEEKLLLENFQIPKTLLFTSRLHYPPPPNPLGFDQRKDFFLIGNFLHPPNPDSVLWLRKEIWPLIHKELPQAKIHICGAYPPQSMLQLTNPKMGFHVLGSIADPFPLLSTHRVNLAPLRFGAGIKGKIADGWWAGTPVVATSIGAEGMHEQFPWGGEIADDPVEFAQKCILLYTDSEKWIEAQKHGLQIMHHLYSSSINSARIVAHFIETKKNLSQLRQKNLIGSLLHFHLHRSTEYFSRWIEAKNVLLRGQVPSP